MTSKTNSLTGAQMRELVDIVNMGNGAIEGNLDIALRLLALFEASGISDRVKEAKDEVARHPELNRTYDDVRVTIQTITNTKWTVDLSAVYRNPEMATIAEAVLSKKREDVALTMTDLGLRSTSAKDRMYLRPSMDNAQKVIVKRCTN